MNGDLLQKFRKEKGWSQKTLAEKAGVGESSVRAIELNLREGSQKTARKLACALGITVEALANSDVSNPTTERNRETIVSNFLEMLMDENIITDPENISDDLAKLIMLNVKKELNDIKEKKQV